VFPARGRLKAAAEIVRVPGTGGVRAGEVDVLLGGVGNPSPVLAPGLLGDKPRGELTPDIDRAGPCKLAFGGAGRGWLCLGEVGPREEAGEDGNVTRVIDEGEVISD
jgi:hypothetical protein